MSTLRVTVSDEEGNVLEVFHTDAKPADRSQIKEALSQALDMNDLGVTEWNGEDDR